MTLTDFRRMPYDERTELLYREGSYIGKRNIRGIVKVLYQLQQFYVEICYHKYRTTISSMNFFSTTARLDPYLDQVDICQLIKQHIE